MAWFAAFLIISILILLNALYVAAEFATVSSRRSRLVQIAAEGNPLARILVPIVRDRRRLDTYVATCQIGITISSLLLGFFGQSKLTPAVAALISGSQIGGPEILPTAAALSITATLVLILLTTLQVILGELVPKSIGIQYPEQLALLTTLPMRWSTILFKPLIWIFNGSGRLILRLLGMSHDIEKAHTHVHTAREILLLVEESSAGGLLDREERRLVKNSLELRQINIRQVMIPRTRIFSAPVQESCENLLTLLADSPYSRLLLHDESVDNIVGVLHLKDLLCLKLHGGQPDVRAAMRSVHYIPETTPASVVFSLLQKQRYHVAIVLDEFGGTAGMVTLEDLVEEIFGELQDEFDEETSPPIRVLSNEWVAVRGDMLVDELNEALGLYLTSEGVDTVGGWVLNSLGRVPDVGEEIVFENTCLVVDAMKGKGVDAVRIQVTQEQIERLEEWL